MGACLVDMAIRMKEWGMLRAPAPAVRIPVQGVLGWDEVAKSVGDGISSVITGGAALAQEKEEVNAVGDLAEFSQRLHSISAETRAELAGRDVADWEYSWQELSAPRFAEAVAELPPAAREAGRELAEAFSRRAAVQSLRDREVARLGEARDKWKQRVDAAVESGDAQRAETWLQSGAGIFVPQGEMEEERCRVRSGACMSAWRKALQQQPLVALADIREAAPSELPQNKADKRYFEAEVNRTRRDELAKLCSSLAAQVEDEDSFDESELRLARRAGLIDERQLESAMAQPRALTSAERCTWLRKVDDVGTEPESRLALKLDIVTAAVPMKERRELLARLAVAEKVNPRDRQALSRSLWQLYERGSLGCPGDEASLQRLAELQRAGLPVLAEEGPESAARWVEHVRGGGDRWVCFSDK